MHDTSELSKLRHAIDLMEPPNFIIVVQVVIQYNTAQGRCDYRQISLVNKHPQEEQGAGHKEIERPKLY